MVMVGNIRPSLVERIHRDYPDLPQTATPDFLPVAGAIAHKVGNGTLTLPTTPDVLQQDIIGIEGKNPLTSGDREVFRGAPNTGLS